MSTNLEIAWKMFREAIAVLALSADEQRRVNGPGCLSCDLLNDFHFARDLFVSNFDGTLTVEQRAVIAETDAIISSMQAADLECFNDEAMCRPVWQTLRQKACEALRVFGCEGETVTPFVEVQPGVWHRPAPE